MKTNKDLLFVIVAFVWLMSNIVCFLLLCSEGIAISNLICICSLGTMTIIKIWNKKFGLCLENPLSTKKT